MICPKCGVELIRRMSNQGEEFLGCPRFPQCRGSAPSLRSELSKQLEELGRVMTVISKSHVFCLKIAGSVQVFTSVWDPTLLRTFTELVQLVFPDIGVTFQQPLEVTNTLAAERRKD
jgi:ssDNA-binding Zn-finger/Zn-ribbon topoisomerase 1